MNSYDELTNWFVESTQVKHALGQYIQQEINHYELIDALNEAYKFGVGIFCKENEYEKL